MRNGKKGSGFQSVTSTYLKRRSTKGVPGNGDVLPKGGDIALKKEQTEEGRKGSPEPEKGSQKSEEVGNPISLPSMPRLQSEGKGRKKSKS